MNKNLMKTFSTLGNKEKKPKGENNLVGWIAMSVFLIVSFFLGYLSRGAMDTRRQIRLDLDKTEIRMKVDEVNEILSLVNDLVIAVEKYGSSVNEILIYRDGELENRIRFRDRGIK